MLFRKIFLLLCLATTLSANAQEKLLWSKNTYIRLYEKIGDEMYLSDSVFMPVLYAKSYDTMYHSVRIPMRDTTTYLYYIYVGDVVAAPWQAQKWDESIRQGGILPLTGAIHDAMSAYSMRDTDRELWTRTIKSLIYERNWSPLPRDMELQLTLQDVDAIMKRVDRYFDPED